MDSSSQAVPQSPQQTFGTNFGIHVILHARSRVNPVRRCCLINSWLLGLELTPFCQGGPIPSHAWHCWPEREEVPEWMVELAQWAPRGLRAGHAPRDQAAGGARLKGCIVFHRTVRIGAWHQLELREVRDATHTGHAEVLTQSPRASGSSDRA
eukprot:671622-Amphidinium_carterae.2